MNICVCNVTSTLNAVMCIFELGFQCVCVYVIIDCPVSEVNDYRVEVLVRLRKLEKLDKDPYTEDERADAEEVTLCSK